MAGLYVHIPFCARKCVYCDFYSIGSRNAPWGKYVDALIAECEMRVRELRNGETIESFYVGGGTPSQMPAEDLRRLAKGIRELFGTQWQPEELTIEVNPDDVTDELAATLREIGFNRVSMGVQTFNDDELHTLNRRHTAQDALRAYGILASQFGNISIDLMFGLPGQTFESWGRSLDRAIELEPTHVSAYSLMWEEGTVLWKMRSQGRVSEAPECDTEAMFEMLCDCLAGAGYEHYEISNFCQPGFRSRHNSSYWRGTPYIGLGASAHSYDGGRIRTANRADVVHYIGETGSARFVENLSDVELREEFIMTRLRTREGISMDEYWERFGKKAVDVLIKNAVPHLNVGRLCLERDAIRLTRKGILTSDSIIVDLMM